VRGEALELGPRLNRTVEYVNGRRKHRRQNQDAGQPVADHVVRGQLEHEEPDVTTELRVCVAERNGRERDSKRLPIGRHLDPVDEPQDQRAVENRLVEDWAHVVAQLRHEHLDLLGRSLWQPDWNRLGGHCPSDTHAHIEDDEGQEAEDQPHAQLRCDSRDEDLSLPHVREPGEVDPDAGEPRHKREKDEENQRPNANGDGGPARAARATGHAAS